MRLCILLYTNVNCGLRQIVEILKVLNQVFGGLLGEVPCHNTIANWVKKSGLKVYESSPQTLKETDYAQIVDESMMIGSEKLLLILGVPAKHQGRPLKCSDVSLLDIAVAESWNGENIGQQLEKAATKVGKAPNYVISDNATVMNKGIKCSGFDYIRDISHTLGMLSERVYKNDTEFNNYLKEMTEVKFKYNMKKIAYLLPPKQRTIARFMNLTDWVEWSSKILDNYHNLSNNERTVFSFVAKNASLIEELSDVVKCINQIEYKCKIKGLSKESIKECKQEINRLLLCGNERMMRLGISIYKFLNEELKLINTEIPYNNSSDILESLFGKYKARKSPNKLNGVTPFILFLPIYTRLKDNIGNKQFDFKGALEDIHIKQIEVWKKENLTTNLASKRIICLKKSA